MKDSLKKPIGFRIIKHIVRFIYPKNEIIGFENIGEEPTVIVGNHSQIHGPIACELFFPENYYIWCAGQMMHLKDVPAYAFKDFWSQKPKYTHWFYKTASYLIAPLSVLLFNNARTIAVYRDTKILRTFKESVSKLQDGKSLIIFPEKDVKYNNIIYEFQDKFIDVARFYYKKTGKELSFTPMYIAPKLKKIYLGKPVKFSANTPIDKERKRICDYLMNEITDIAVNSPEHTVIPYRNINKKLYPKNK